MQTSAQYPPSILHTNNGIIEYRYRTVSVTHLAQLQEDIDRLRREGRLSQTEAFLDCLADKRFVLPEDFPTARFMVIVAVSHPPATFDFQYQGARVPAVIPSTYYNLDSVYDRLPDEIQQQIIKEPGYRVKQVETFHHKLLAVRSGLGRYGRNNICYVEGFGSFLTLHTYLTDYPFETDHWQEIQRMDRCEDCRICLDHCPNGAIREEEFVIDAGRCLTLYNENTGDFPAWMSTTVHHSVIGCLKCQAPCPANRAAMQSVRRLEDITEEETRQLLEGTPDPGVRQSVLQKLKISFLFDGEMPGITARNVRAILTAQGK